jgi:NhaC family Na+:H+ antiporter
MSEASDRMRSPSLADALIPVATLVALLSLSVYLFGNDSSYGPNQIALILSAGIAIVIGLKNGYSWQELEAAIARGVGLSTGAILILLSVGALIGAWILSGTVPTLVYYGLLLLDPSFFYLATCIICAIVALSVGSSWTVAGTIGVALIGVAAGLGMSLPVTAGAVISGAYFGDKMSPLSDTTNLAPAVAGTELFTHIRHMLWTTVPSILIALIAFGVMGLTATPASTEAGLSDTLAMLKDNFDPSWPLLLPVLLVMVLAYRKWPAFPTVLIGALVGALFALIFQPDRVMQMGTDGVSGALALIGGVWVTLFDGYVSETGHADVDDLLTRGGMSSMLNTIWLVVAAMTFGAVMERVGLLMRLVTGSLAAAKSAGSLIITTLLTAIGVNIITADQYMAIVLPGRSYRLEFERRRLSPVNLSRAVEDAGTLSSPLIPWNACGAFMAGTLGVPTLAYLPFCFFNLINPVIAGAFAWYGFRITSIEDEPPAQGIDGR